MNNYTRSDIFMQMSLHEKEESVWHADLTKPIPLLSFQLHDFASASSLILSDCSVNFAVQCGDSSRHDLIGTPVNRFIFGQHQLDVVIHKDSNGFPNILKFISIHDENDQTGKGFLNSVGLLASDTMLVGMFGRRRDITHQLKSKAERLALKNSLTTKEFEIFLSLAEGRTVKQIASSAGLMEKTVYFHLENIGRKMHTGGIIDIIVKAYRLGFLDARELP